MTNEPWLYRISCESEKQLTEHMSVPSNGGLKVDFHTHTADDPEETIRYSSRELIDKAQRLGFDAICITNHNAVSADGYLRDYASERDIVLIPGVEIDIRGKHVLVINAREDILKASSFDDLRRLRTPECLVIAPHPYFPGTSSLRGKMWKNIDIFDAIEFSWFYHRYINFNAFAVRMAAKRGLPVIGTSDCHSLSRFGRTYSLVEAEKDAGSIVEAVRAGRVEIVASPLNLIELGMHGVEHLVSVSMGTVKKLFSGGSK